MYCGQRCKQAVWGRRRRADQRRRTLADRSQWWTPPAIRARVLAGEWGPVGLDAAACAQSTLVPGNWLGPTSPVSWRQDARTVVWAELVRPGETVYCNPPYAPAALLGQFLERCVDTSIRGVAVTALLAASPCTAWWNRWVVGGGATVEFLPGRLSYSGPFAESGGVAPFGAALVHWSAQPHRGVAAADGPPARETGGVTSASATDAATLGAGRTG
jgi:hypothetical protein